MSNNIFDGKFNGMGRSEMYRALFVPDVFPHEKPMLILNWDPEDREAYCGGVYTPGYAEREWVKHYQDLPQRYILGAE